MIPRLIVALLVYGSTLAYSVPRAKNASVKEKWVLFSIFLVSLYSALSFIMQKLWPNLDDIMHVLLGKLGKSIVSHVKRS